MDSRTRSRDRRSDTRHGDLNDATDAVPITEREALVGRLAWAAAWFGVALGLLHALSRYRTEDGSGDLDAGIVSAWADPAWRPLSRCSRGPTRTSCTRRTASSGCPSSRPSPRWRSWPAATGPHGVRAVRVARDAVGVRRRVPERRRASTGPSGPAEPNGLIDAIFLPSCRWCC